MAIISFKHRYIFIKTQKTAGTSLEVHFARQCGDEDIVTPIMPPVEGHRPRNFDRDGLLFKNHMLARDIRAALPEAFDGFYKFCFERHPVEKCLSYYAMLRNSSDHKHIAAPPSWETYLQTGPLPIDSPKYTDVSGNLIIDRVYRYEEMDAALADIEAKTGVHFGPLTVREKAGLRYGVPTFDEVMSRTEQRDRIFSVFAASLRITPY